MKKTIGIVAPTSGGTQVHINFILRLERHHRELTLKTLYELAQHGWQADKISRGFRDEEMGTAAGYYLSTILRQQGYQTVLITTYDDEALQQLAETDPFSICLSTTMILDNASLKTIVSRIRHYLPDTLLIAGGVYVWKSYYIYKAQQIVSRDQRDTSHTLFYSDSADMGIDVFVIAPHGKETLLWVLQEAERGSRADFTHIPNLAFPDKTGTCVFTRFQEEDVDYNTDYTRWDLLDKLPNRIPFRTSIGCPFRCRFCDFCRLYPKLFLRTTESLVAELQLLKRQLANQPATLYITDDNAFSNAQRVHDLCHTIMTAGIRGWQGFLRASSITPSNVSLVRQSGLFMALVGVESGDSEQLKRMNKAQSVEEIKQGIELLDQHGIVASMTFLVGFPGETAKSIENTIYFLKQLSLGKSGSTYHVYPLAITPLSELDGAALRARWHISGIGNTWSHATMTSEEAVTACYHIFKQVSSVPFHYLEESYFFNRQVFTETQRLRLYALRKKLTVQLLERTAWHPIAATLAEISRTMGFPEHAIPESFRHEIVVPAIQGVNA